MAQLPHIYTCLHAQTRKDSSALVAMTEMVAVSFQPYVSAGLRCCDGKTAFVFRPWVGGHSAGNHRADTSANRRS